MNSAAPANDEVFHKLLHSENGRATGNIFLKT
jgi:hypothetical protein